MYNSNTKVAVCNSVTQSKTATAALVSLNHNSVSGSDFTENGGTQSALLLPLALTILS